MNGAVGLLVIPDMYQYDSVIPGDAEIEDGVKRDVIMDEMLAGETEHRGGVDGGRTRDAALVKKRKMAVSLNEAFRLGMVFGAFLIVDSLDL